MNNKTYNLQSGAAYIELSLVLPVFLLLLFGVFTTVNAISWLNSAGQGSFNASLLTSLSQNSVAEDTRIAQKIERLMSYNKMFGQGATAVQVETIASSQVGKRASILRVSTNNFGSVLNLGQKYSFHDLMPKITVSNDVFFEGSQESGANATWNCNGTRTSSAPSSCY
jgi:hypothetical protein